MLIFCQVHIDLPRGKDQKVKFNEINIIEYLLWVPWWEVLETS